MGWSDAVFEMRQEVQDLVLDVVLQIACVCPDQAAVALVSDATAVACLACRALHVLLLARRLRGNSWIPPIGVVHRAGLHIACVDKPRRGFPNGVPIAGRQTCEDCAAVLTNGPHGFGWGTLVALYFPAEDVMHGGMRATRASIVRSSNAPGLVMCTDLPASRIRLLSETVPDCTNEVRRSVAGVNRRAS